MSSSPFPASDLRRPAPAGEAESFRRETLGLLGAVLGLVAQVTGAAAEEAPIVVPVTVTAERCEPMELTVPAGKVTFVVTNRSRRALEWEILQGVMVVDERENIAPGFKARLTTRLDPGTYEITCGLLDNPRGRLVVTGAAAAATAADLAGPTAEYRVVTAGILADLGAALDRLKAAGADRDAARPAFLEARAQVLALAPIRAEAAALAEAVAADLAALDRLLFGEPGADPSAAIAALDADARALATALRPLVVPAERLLAGTVALAVDLARETAAPTSSTALSALEAKRGAIERVVTLFAPLVARRDPDGAAALLAALARLKQELAVAGSFAGRADALALTPEVRRAQVAAADDLAARLARLPAGLGL